MAIWLVAFLTVVKSEVGHDGVIGVGERGENVGEREATLA